MGTWLTLVPLQRTLLMSLSSNKKIGILLECDVQKIDEKNDGYDLETSKGSIRSDFVSVDAGSYSLHFAKSLGYGQNLVLVDWRWVLLLPKGA